MLASIAEKSVTTPIAMAIAQQIGGIPSLTAVLVITTGVLGAMMVTPVMNALRIRDYAARGFAAGVASHGIGTARAFQVNDLAGTFSGLAMGLQRHPDRADRAAPARNCSGAGESLAACGTDDHEVARLGAVNGTVRTHDLADVYLLAIYAIVTIAGGRYGPDSGSKPG